MIEFHQVSKWYGKFQALKDINETVTQGEIVVVCGSSGSGKSTLIRCVNRLEPIQSGTIQINGENIYKPNLDFNKFRSKIGFVFQQFNLFPHLNVVANCILAPVKLGLMSEVEAKEKALSVLNRVGLANKAHEFPEQLSGGQQQRVAISRALMMNPPIMLFDEPTSALDPEMVGEVLRVIKDLAKDGMTLMIVTHEMGFARDIANRVLFMDQGQIIERASPDKFFTNPQHPRAQKFLSDIRNPFS